MPALHVPQVSDLRLLPHYPKAGNLQIFHPFDIYSVKISANSTDEMAP